MHGFRWKNALKDAVVHAYVAFVVLCKKLVCFLFFEMLLIFLCTVSEITNIVTSLSIPIFNGHLT